MYNILKQTYFIVLVELFYLKKIGIHLLLLLLISLLSSNTFSQIFNNPSFEGINGQNIAPPQWNICAATPDLLPSFTAIFPSNGNSCIGMLRFIGHDESIGQRLPTALDSTKCYSFNLDLRNGSPYGFDVQPGKMGIWFGDSACDKQFLAWMSPFIAHESYVTYPIFFQPDRNYTHVIFELQAASDSTKQSAIGMDNIHNQMISTSTINLGSDRLICLGDSFLINPPGANLSYLWNTGSTDSILWVNSPGVYSVTVSDLNGCQKSDEIIISYPDTLDLGPDTSLCANDSLSLNSNILGTTYTWQDGSSTRSLIAKDSGLYNVQVVTGNCIQKDSILVKIGQDVIFTLGNDTVLCNGDTLLLSVNIPGASLKWQDNSTNPDFVIRNSGTFYVELTKDFCTFTDTINVEFKNLVPIDLGADSSICIGDSMFVSINQVLGTNILWSTGEQTNGIWVHQPGKYFVDERIGSCLESDTIEISFKNTNVLNTQLGNDTTLCIGASLTLDASHPNASYRWQDLSTANNFIVSAPGTYSVLVTENGCSDSDTIQVFGSDTLDLGNDISICEGDSVLLSSNIMNASYLWQNNNTSSAIFVKDSGNYKLMITKDGCQQEDSILVHFFEKPIFSLGPDRDLCFPDSIVLNASAPNSTFIWQDQSTNPSFTVKQGGEYSVRVFNSGCQYRDTVTIDLIDLSFSLGMDSTLCLLDSIVLDIDPNKAFNPVWFNGSNQNSIVIKQTELVWAQVSQGTCFFRDSVNITFRNTPRPNINLGNDTTLCLMDSLNLNAFWNNVSTYQWQDGSQQSFFTVKIPGKYQVEIIDNNCSSVDSINVLFADTIDLSIPNSLCLGETLDLDFTLLNATYLWQDNSTLPSFSIIDSGLYWVKVNANNCFYESDSVFVNEIDCTCKLELPNVFTPNKDGINDLFYVESDCDLEDFSLSIYNRFGALIISEDYQEYKWDGFVKGNPVHTGIYFYLIEFKDLKGKPQFYKGSITLFR